MEWTDVFGDWLRWSALASRKLRRYLGRRLSFLRKNRWRAKRRHFSHGLRLENVDIFENFEENSDEEKYDMTGGRRSRRMSKEQRQKFVDDETYAYFREPEPPRDPYSGEVHGEHGRLSAGSPPPGRHTFAVTQSTTDAVLASGSQYPQRSAVGALNPSVSLNLSNLNMFNLTTPANPSYQPQRPVEVQSPMGPPGDESPVNWDIYRTPAGIHGPAQAPQRRKAGIPEIPPEAPILPVMNYGRLVEKPGDVASVGGVSLFGDDPFSDVESTRSGAPKQPPGSKAERRESFPPITKRRESHSGSRRDSPIKKERSRSHRGPRTPPPEKSSGSSRSRSSRRTPSPRPSPHRKGFHGDPRGLRRKQEEERRREERRRPSSNESKSTTAKTSRSSKSDRRSRTPPSRSSRRSSTPPRSSRRSSTPPRSSRQKSPTPPRSSRHKSPTPTKSRSKRSPTPPQSSKKRTRTPPSSSSAKSARQDPTPPPRQVFVNPQHPQVARQVKPVKSMGFNAPAYYAIRNLRGQTRGVRQEDVRNVRGESMERDAQSLHSSRVPKKSKDDSDVEVMEEVVTLEDEPEERQVKPMPPYVQPDRPTIREVQPDEVIARVVQSSTSHPHKGPRVVVVQPEGQKNPQVLPNYEVKVSKKSEKKGLPAERAPQGTNVRKWARIDYQNTIRQETLTEHEARYPKMGDNVDWMVHFRTEAQLFWAVGLREPTEQGFMGGAYPSEEINLMKDAKEALVHILDPKVMILGPRNYYFLNQFNARHREKRDRSKMVKKAWHREVQRLLLIAAGLSVEHVLHATVPIYWTILVEASHLFEHRVATPEERALAIQMIPKWALKLQGPTMKIVHEEWPLWELGQDPIKSLLQNHTRTMGEFLFPTWSLWDAVKNGLDPTNESLAFEDLVRDVIDYLNHKYRTHLPNIEPRPPGDTQRVLVEKKGTDAVLPQVSINSSMVVYKNPDGSYKAGNVIDELGRPRSILKYDVSLDPRPPSKGERLCVLPAVHKNAGQNPQQIQAKLVMEDEDWDYPMHLLYPPNIFPEMEPYKRDEDDAPLDQLNPGRSDSPNRRREKLREGIFDRPIFVDPATGNAFYPTSEGGRIYVTDRVERGRAFGYELAKQYRVGDMKAKQAPDPFYEGAYTFADKDVTEKNLCVETERKKRVFKVPPDEATRSKMDSERRCPEENCLSRIPVRYNQAICQDLDRPKAYYLSKAQMQEEIKQTPQANLNMNPDTSSYHPMLCYGRIHQGTNNLRYSDSWVRILSSNNGRQFFKDCWRCAMVAIDLEGVDDPRMMGMINADMLNSKYERKSAFAQFRMTTMTGITIVVGVDFTGRFTQGAMLPSQICEVLSSNRVFKLGIDIQGDVWKLAAANVVVNNTVDVGHVLRYLVPKFKKDPQERFGLPDKPGKRHCLRALRLEARAQEVEKFKEVITMWDFSSHVSPGTTDVTVQDKIREGAYNIIDDYLPFLVIFRVVEALTRGRGLTDDTNMLEPCLALCARCKDWTCTREEDLRYRDVTTSKGPTQALVNPFYEAMPGQACDKEMVCILNDIGLLFSFEDAMLSPAILHFGPQGNQTRVGHLKAQVDAIRGRRPGTLLEEFNEFAHRTFVAPQNYARSIHPCHHCNMVHNVGIGIKNRQCYTQKPCIYPLCPNKTEHAVSACPHLVQICARCGLVGHHEKDHQYGSILELRNLLRLYYITNPALLPLMNRDMTLTVEKQNAGAELVVNRPAGRVKPKIDLLYRAAEDAFNFLITPVVAEVSPDEAMAEDPNEEEQMDTHEVGVDQGPQ